MSPQILNVKRPLLATTTNVSTTTTTKTTRRSLQSQPQSLHNHNQNQFNSIEMTDHQNEGSSTPPPPPPSSSSPNTSSTSSTIMVTSLPALSMQKSTTTTSTTKTMVKKRSKSAFRCRFFVNGDRHFIGIYYVINIDRLRTLDSLCRELSRILVNVKTLPSGVRIIFNCNDGMKINSIQQFRHNENYCCSSNEHFIRLDYITIADGNNSFSINDRQSTSPEPKNLLIINNSMTTTAAKQQQQQQQQQQQKQQQQSRTPLAKRRVDSGGNISGNNNNNNNNTTMMTTSSTASSTQTLSTSTTTMTTTTMSSNSLQYCAFRPKLVALLRGSCRAVPSMRPSRRVFRFLFNHRIAQNYEQLLNEISKSVKLNVGAVHRIYGLSSSKKITCLNDLYDDEYVYLVYGRAEKCNINDFLLDEYEQREICSIVGVSYLTSYYENINNHSLNLNNINIHNNNNGKSKLPPLPPLSLSAKMAAMTKNRKVVRYCDDINNNNDNNNNNVSINNNRRRFQSKKFNTTTRSNRNRNNNARNNIGHTKQSKNSDCCNNNNNNDDDDDDDDNDIKAYSLPRNFCIHNDDDDRNNNNNNNNNKCKNNIELLNMNERTPTNGHHHHNQHKFDDQDEESENYNCNSITMLTSIDDDYDNDYAVIIADNNYNDDDEYQQKRKLPLENENIGSISSSSYDQNSNRSNGRDQNMIISNTNGTKIDDQSGRSYSSSNSSLVFVDNNQKHHGSNQHHHHHHQINQQSMKPNTNQSISNCDYRSSSMTTSTSTTSTNTSQNQGIFIQSNGSSTPGGASSISCSEDFSFTSIDVNNSNTLNNDEQQNFYSDNDDDDESVSIDDGQSIVKSNNNNLSKSQQQNSNDSDSDLSSTSSFSSLSRVIPAVQQCQRSVNISKNDDKISKPKAANPKLKSPVTSLSTTNTKTNSINLTKAANIKQRAANRMAVLPRNQMVTAAKNTKVGSKSSNVNVSTQASQNHNRSPSHRIGSGSRNSTGSQPNTPVKKKIPAGYQSQQPQQQRRAPVLTTIPAATKFQPKKEVDEIYFVDKSIGDGKFGVVYTCIHRETRQSFALKVVNKYTMQQVFSLPKTSSSSSSGHNNYTDKSNDPANAEVAILSRVNHPNIVRLYDHFNYVDQCYLVLELLQGGDLFDAITVASRYTEAESALMISDLLNALYYLHQMNIVHRDIKLENLLVSYVPIPLNDNNSPNNDETINNRNQQRQYRRMIKLADFGLAVEVEPGEKLYTVCGTPTYVAPEILLEIGYSFPVDIWAAGVILYILLSGQPPFANEENDQVQLFDQIISGNFDLIGPQWRHISASAKCMIHSMLVVTQTKRITAQQILNHRWLLQHTSNSNNQSIKSKSSADQLANDYLNLS
nr:probable serine/threonine-protein kinase clkA [Dermatophagoides farinae]